MKVFNCIYIYIFQIFINVYMVNTFEIMFNGSLSCSHTGTQPGMKDHISSHIKRKTELMMQHNDMTPCGLEKA